VNDREIWNGFYCKIRLFLSVTVKFELRFICARSEPRYISTAWRFGMVITAKFVYFYLFHAKTTIPKHHRFFILLGHLQRSRDEETEREMEMAHIL
jgi:hypothetical protein